MEFKGYIRLISLHRKRVVLNSPECLLYATHGGSDNRQSIRSPVHAALLEALQHRLVAERHSVLELLLRLQRRLGEGGRVKRGRLWLLKGLLRWLNSPRRLNTLRLHRGRLSLKLLGLNLLRRVLHRQVRQIDVLQPHHVFSSHRLHRIRQRLFLHVLSLERLQLIRRFGIRRRSGLLWLLYWLGLRVESEICCLGGILAGNGRCGESRFDSPTLTRMIGTHFSCCEDAKYAPNRRRHC